MATLFVSGIYPGLTTTIKTVVVVKPFLIYGETPEEDNAKEDYILFQILTTSYDVVFCYAKKSN